MAESKVEDTSKSGGTSGGSTTPKGGASKGGTSRRKGDVTQDLQNLFDGVAFLATVGGDTFSANIISSRSADLARVWNELAQENASVMRVIRLLTEGSKWQEATMVTLSVVIPIAWKYNLVPQQMGMLFAGDIMNSDPESPPTDPNANGSGGSSTDSAT